jgi:hypothetical protein
MAKLSNKNDETSFHFTTIKTTVNKLVEVLGEPQCEDNTGEDKVNFDWNCETEDGEVFTIYDWKEYRRIHGDENIEFHIGGKDKSITEKAKKELLEMLY